MNVQRVNMFSAKNMANSAEKLSKVNFTNLLKSDSKDSFSTKLMSCDGDTDITEPLWGAFGFAC